MIKSPPNHPGLLANAILWLLSLATAIALFVPVSPNMPGAGLDPSWQYGINQATAQGLAFGKDMIFTYGPYASISTKSYHPSTDFMMVGGGLYLAFAYWACLVILMQGVRRLWILAVCALLIGLGYRHDPLLFSLPLLVGLASFKSVSAKHGGLVDSNALPWSVALLFSPLGLLPLVKGSLLLLCGAVAALGSVFFLSSQRRLPAAICLVSPLAALLFFWSASGQSLTNLPSYFIGMAPIISGYSEAMALDGSFGEIVLYVIACAVILLTISLQSQTSPAAKLFLFCVYFVFLFLSFKAGFVRHDSHALIAGGSILLAALLLPFILDAWPSLPAIVFALLAWSCIDRHYIQTSPRRVVDTFQSTFSSLWHGTTRRANDRNWPRLEFDAARDWLRQQASFPLLQGTTDIYSFNQSYLIASGNDWSPRPILQSYSVYTPELAEANRQHLLGGRAPENIIFRVEPIDKRLPATEDGASWPVLMAGYHPVRLARDFLFLQKNATAGGDGEPPPLASEKHAFGERVPLPRPGQALFAQVEIKPTLLGRMAGILFKPSQIQITLDLDNGTQKQYRLIAGMAKSGFLISPLIESAGEFAMLYGPSDDLAHKRVQSMTIAPRDGATVLWEQEYTVTFSQIDVPLHPGGQSTPSAF